MFVKEDIVLHSGSKSDFKIECDSLTDKDIETFAYLISKRYKFGHIIGIPNGGIRIGRALEKYKDNRKIGSHLLIVDDVLTIGSSMWEVFDTWKDTIHSIQSVVLFARGLCPTWVEPIF